jgi:molybdopterin-guanine dinucleotide biosynthesis protein A
VLAGGFASRLGGEKAGVPLAGRPLIAHTLAALHAAGLEAIVIAKPDTRLPPLDVPIWREPADPHHPACGIVAALDRAARPIVACGCDTPLLPPLLLSTLAATAGPLAVIEAAGGLQPLPGRYTPVVRDELAAALARGASMRSTISQLDPHLVTEAELRRLGEPDQLLLNVNEPADLERAEAILAAREGDG